jgi:hypothetical protein
MGDESEKKETGKIPISKKTDSINFVDLNGKVYGCIGDHYTRPIGNATVFLKIHVRQGKKERVYNTSDKKDIEQLAKDLPEIYRTVTQYDEAFTPRQASRDGEFSFPHVPVDWWCYVIGAYIETKEYDITNKLGNNGFDEPKELTSSQLVQKPKIDGIIIPVEDEWYKKGINHGQKKGDRPTNLDDKNQFRPGIKNR